MILCDTDIMIEFIKGKFEIIGNLFRIQENLPMIPIRLSLFRYLESLNLQIFKFEVSKI